MKSLQNSIPFAMALITGLLMVPLALMGLDFSFYPGDLGDARFNIYLLEHGYQTLLGKHEWYWNAPFMYPVENVITISDNLLGAVPIYSVFRGMGFGIFTSFQLWFIAVFAFNFAAAYWFFNWLLKNRYAAATAAFIFAFSISLQSQMTHAQVFARFFIPIAFLFIFKFGKDFKPKYFFLAALCIVGQFYSGIYLGMLTLLPFAAITLILVLWQRQKLLQNVKSIKWWGLMLASIALNAALLYKLMWPYYQRSLISLPDSYENIFVSIPKFISYIFSKDGSLLWQSLDSIAKDIPAWYDHQLFPGIFVCVSLLASIVLLVKYRDKNRLEIGVLFIIGLTTLLLFIRVGDFTLYQYIYKIPGFHSLRSLTRIIGIDLIFFGLAAGLFVKYLVEKFPKNRFVTFSVILAFLVIDNYVDPAKTYRSSKEIARERVDTLIGKMERLPKGTIVSYEPEEVDLGSFVQIDAMLASQALGLICLNGYSATSPGKFSPYWMEPNAENRKFWLESVGLDPDLPVVIK